MKIVLRIPKVLTCVDYGALELGDYFIRGDDLYMKYDGYSPGDICIQKDILYKDICYDDCVLVNAKIETKKALKGE